MKVSHPLVVKSPPLNHDSVLVVTEDSRLGQLLARWNALCEWLERSIAEVQAELAALRAGFHNLSEFAYTPSPIDHEDEPLFFRSRVLPDGTRVDVSKRSDGLYNVIPVDEGRCYWGLTAEGVEQLFTTVVYDYLQEKESQDAERVRDFETNWFQTIVVMEVGVRDGLEFKPKEITRTISARETLDNGNWIRKPVAYSPSFWLPSPEPTEKRFVALPVKPWVDGRRETFLSMFGALTLPRIATGSLTDEQYAARHKNDESAAAAHLPNWCSTCEQYVAWSHDGPNGKACEDYLKKIEADAVERATKREKTLAEYCVEFTKKNNAKLAAKGWVGYSPEEFDLDILKSRGSVMDDAVRQFEKDHSRRLNKWRVR